MEQIQASQDRAHLERILKMLGDNLRVYEEQAAAFGGLYIPPFLVRQIDETKLEISKVQEQLHRYEVISGPEANVLPRVSHNLPSPIQLIDRTSELIKLTSALNNPSITSVIIEGLMGTGKTALACNLANNLWSAGEYKGAVWISAEKGTLTLNSMIDIIAIILDYPNLVRLAGEEKTLAAINILRTQKVLLILDGYEKVEEDIEIKYFLSRISFPSKVLITINKRGTDFNNSYVFYLKGLDAQGSLALIAHECNRLNIRGVEKLPEKTLNRLHEITSGNPYAIKLSIGQIKRFGLTFDSILSRLAMAQGQLFEHIYDSSWKSLKEDHRLILKAISVLGGSTSLLALEEIIKISFWDLESRLAELVEMSLVETNSELEREKIRYAILSLTRTYVLNSIQDETDLQNTLLSAASDYYLDFCKKYEKTFVVLQDELENLRIIIDWCRNVRPDAYIQFIRLLYPFFRDVGYWQDALLHLGFAIEISKNRGQKVQSGWLYCELASILIRMGGQEELNSARSVLYEAKEIFQGINDLEGMCAVYGRQARVAQKQKDYENALKLGLDALNLAKEKNLISRIADIQHEVGDTYRMIGDLEAAKVHYEESLKSFQALNDAIRVAGRLADLGYLALQNKQFVDAKSLFLESITVSEQNNKKDTLTRALNGLALVQEHLNFPLRSYHSAMRAKQIANSLGAMNESQQASDIANKMLEEISSKTVWIFNFNNTLADTYTLNVEAWVLACQHFGFDVPTFDLEVELKEGSPSKQIAKRIQIPTDKESEVIKLKRSIFRDNAFRELRLYPDVIETFLKLQNRGDLITICSMVPEAIILETLKRAQLPESVDKIVGLESLADQPDYTSAKVYAAELILDYIPIAKDHFIVIGDSQHEHNMSRLLGVRHIHFNRFTTQQFSEKYAGTCEYVKTLSEIINYS